MHPATAVTAGVVSAASNHPFPALAVGVTLGLILGVGVTYTSVGTLPVAVYVGNSVSAPASTPEIVAGGHTPNSSVAAASIVPAPLPPVCHAL